MSQPVIINVNTIPISPVATSIICSYPLTKIRSCIPIQEYINYKHDWNLFNTVWSYNYTVSTLNGTSGSYNPWQFSSNGSAVSYSNGQSAHVACYPKDATVFKNFY